MTPFFPWNSPRGVCLVETGWGPPFPIFSQPEEDPFLFGARGLALGRRSPRGRPLVFPAAFLFWGAFYPWKNF